MSDPPRQPDHHHEWPWNHSQRRVILVLCAALIIYLAGRLWFHPAHIDRPQSGDGPRARELLDRIDPNTADWSTIAAIPGVGESRARAIVDYRETFLRENPDHLPFQTPEDLLRIKGIGVSLMRTMSAHMAFPATRPSIAN